MNEDIDPYYKKQDHVVSFIIHCSNTELERIKDAICMFEGVKLHEGGYLVSRMKSALLANAKRFQEAADSIIEAETK